MLRKSDIELAAHYLVARRGECAAGCVEKRAQDLAREGSGEAALIWQLIAGQIRMIHGAHGPVRLGRGRLIVINGGRA